MRTQLNKEFDINTSTWEVSSFLPVKYTVVEKNDFFSSSGYQESIFGQKNGGTTRRLIVIDHTVVKHFEDKILDYFNRNDVIVELLILEADEESKTLDTVFTVLNRIIELRLQRRSEPVIAIGGGVLLDIVGLAASLYRRGIPYVRVPTTLIGIIDAGIGIKTGVNYGAHKNRVGTYYPPISVLLDTTFLSTLSERHLRNGMGEVLKMALIKDATLFSLLEKSSYLFTKNAFHNQIGAQAIVRRSIHSMLEELEKNLWEKDLERLVDFGHSFSPIIEMKALPELLHGEAVAIDMAICAVIAHNRKLLTKKELHRIFHVFKTLGLPAYHTICSVEILIEALRDTTRHRDGLQRMPLPKGIGAGIFVNNITNQEIKTAVRFLKEKTS